MAEIKNTFCFCEKKVLTTQVSKTDVESSKNLVQIYIYIYFYLTACYPFCFVSVSAKFGICTVVSVNGTLVEAKMRTFTLESTHFIFNKCPIYTQDGASSKFCTTCN